MRSVLILRVGVGRVSYAVVSAGRRKSEGLEVRWWDERGRGGARHVVIQVSGSARAVHQGHGVVSLSIDILKLEPCLFVFHAFNYGTLYVTKFNVQ